MDLNEVRRRAEIEELKRRNDLDRAEVGVREANLGRLEEDVQGTNPPRVVQELLPLVLTSLILLVIMLVLFYGATYLAYLGVTMAVPIGAFSEVAFWVLSGAVALTTIAVVHVTLKRVSKTRQQEE